MFDFSYFLNFFKKKDDSFKKNFLTENFSRIVYFSNIISGKKIEIIKADDDIGGYYDNKLILPENIKIKNQNNIFYFYIYRILFSIESENLNFYLRNDKKNFDYIMLASILTVKDVNFNIFNKYPNSIFILRKLYYDLCKIRNNLDCLDNGRAFLIEILIMKLMFKKINIKKKISTLDKFWIFLVENSDYSNLEYLYNELCKYYKFYENIEFNQIWGYLYYKNDLSFKNLYKIELKNINNSNFLKEKNSLVKKINIKSDKNKNNTLNSLFDYKKTFDNYEKSNDKYVENNDINNINILNKLNSDNIIRSSSPSYSSSFFLKSINSLNITNSFINFSKSKKFTYKEWDFNFRNYKNDWCEVFVSQSLPKTFSDSNKNFLIDYFKFYKKEIFFLKNKIKIMMNKSIYINNLCFGKDLNIDSIIDNYKHIKKYGFDKIYRDKRIIEKDICLCLMLDSSLSTEGFIGDTKIIDFLKILAFILSSSLDDFVKTFIVSAFYSNTRHDCRYFLIKKIDESWKKVAHNLFDLNSIGYTRIGPAIRHSIKEIDKYKFKKKVILLISDGKPTDYDEYEGFYGINDVRRAIFEARLKNIDFKSIILSKNKKHYFDNMFGKNNFYLISNTSNFSFKLSRLFFDMILKKN